MLNALSKKDIEEKVLRLFEDCDILNINFFGGEPLLRKDLIRHTINFVKEKNLETTFTLTTNGLLLDKDFICYLEEVNKTNFINVEVSYDGVGQRLRLLQNGRPSKEKIEEVLTNLDNSMIDYCVRYTITSANYDECIKDFVRIYKTYVNIKKIMITVAYDDIIESKKITYENIVLELKNINGFLGKILYLYSIFNKPFCDYICEHCTTPICSINYDSIAHHDIVYEGVVKYSVFSKNGIKGDSKSTFTEFLKAKDE